MEHTQLISGLPKRAERYPKQFCLLVAKAIAQHVRGGPEVQLGLWQPPSFDDGLELHENLVEGDEMPPLPSPEQVPVEPGDERIGKVYDHRPDRIGARRTLLRARRGGKAKLLEEEIAKVTDLEKDAVKRAHVNLGHVPLRTLIRMMRNARVRQLVLEWTRRSFRCQACEAQQMPKNALPAKVSRNYEFNLTVGVDCATVDAGASQVTLCHIVCWGTRMHAGRYVKDKSAETVCKTIMEMWVSGQEHLR